MPTQRYKNLNGFPVPSVTTIIGRFKDSGPLIHWAYNQGIAGKALYDERDKAATCGTLAHTMVEEYLNGNDHMNVLRDHDPDVMANALQAFHNFERWLDSSNIEILSQFQEIPYVCEKYQFGGCFDAIGRNKAGELCLLDWKTSNGIYRDYALQLAAYKHLWDVHNPNDPIIGGFHLCRFSKTYPDFNHAFFRELDLAWKQFKLLRQAFEIDKELKARIK